MRPLRTAPRSIRRRSASCSSGAAGYMPWGFMAGGNNGDGDDQLGLDGIWHGADWDSLRRSLHAKADDLARQAVDVVIATAALSPGSRCSPPPAFACAGLKGDIIHQLSERTPVTVLGAAQAKDGLSWWPVRVALGAGQAEDGWMAQSPRRVGRCAGVRCPPRFGAGWTVLIGVFMPLR